MLDAYIHQPRLEAPEIVTQFELPPPDILMQEILRDRWLVNRIDALARPEGLKISDIEDPEHEHPIIMCRPTLTEGILALRTQYAKTVTLVVYATGTSPHWLAPVIKRLVDNGVPVFLVADCPGDEAGILKSDRYEAAVPALNAGAIPIEKVNVRDVTLVKEAAKDWSEKLSGQELANYIQQMFAYQSGEEKPKAAWDTPEGVVRYRQEVIEPMLFRFGVPREKIPSIAEVWENGSVQLFLAQVEQACIA